MHIYKVRIFPKVKDILIWNLHCTISYMKGNVLQDLHIWISAPLRWLLLHVKLVFQPRKMLKTTITWHKTDSICANFHGFFSEVKYSAAFLSWSYSVVCFMLLLIQLENIHDRGMRCKKVLYQFFPSNFYKCRN